MKRARLDREARADSQPQTAYRETLRKSLGVPFRTEIKQPALRAAMFPLDSQPDPAGMKRGFVASLPFWAIDTETEFAGLNQAHRCRY